MQKLLRAGPKLYADSYEAGFPLLLDTGTESKQWVIQILNSKFRALARLLFINTLLRLALNSGRARRYQNLVPGTVTKHGSSLIEKLECII